MLCKGVEDFLIRTEHGRTGVCRCTWSWWAWNSVPDSLRAQHEPAVLACVR